MRKWWNEHIVASFDTFGRQLGMFVEVFRTLVTDIAKRQFPFGEFVRQCAFMTSTSVFPTLLVAIPIGVIVSIQVSNIAGQIGANAFAGAATGLGVIRQGAPLVTALIMAGAIGSAIAADLGSRTIRDEIDAMKVMGVNPVQRLISPRLLATMVVSFLLCGFVCFVGFITGYVFNVYMQGGTPGSYTSTFASFAGPADLWFALIKAVIFGAIVAIVACDRGLNTKGGPAGVADSVNAAVVNSVILLFTVNVAMTQVFALVIPAKVV
ncbi:MAG TPA: ABC transporter permease [Gordonia sp. (in: high G+C Gram-positive bacteria)]|uniref:MlaE family ABC transporter permease n=1 Tax=unclassified Gordonia (in: high G+C Gram-positive bacteria) TaxID=2657482 RepID=UPI000FB5FFD3|nr:MULTISPECIES: ABC transporter permease [unclassified Gordonia (in: high G+C Gram-positive bacteria)]RUP37485.1 MAG: ABC transporter permease [Gordonia sp. (in: high G+C Gram-positive bacteria)]HNP58172.1 ABC transporter permease [Gordonia sp. (in: high G+C Gram-positive bacteria)]HRC51759.1 ABC transporter permease [Gordonia sp. (in: high G+C Gram-positive bacteria)]